jgi:hypothetical protein
MCTIDIRSKFLYKRRNGSNINILDAHGWKKDFKSADNEYNKQKCATPP